MGLVKNEVKAFGKEAVRQGCLLIFGTAPKTKPPAKPTKVQRELEEIKSWARRNGFNK